MHRRVSSFRNPRSRVGAAFAAAAALVLTGVVAASPGVASRPRPSPRPSGETAADAAALPQSPELTVSSRLADRRAVVIGHRLYATSTEDGLYPAMGFHTLGEMGGIWSPPIKLLDGIWFGVDGSWLGTQVPAERFASGWGYHRIDYAPNGGLRVQRTDVVPDGPRALLVGLTFRSTRDRQVPLTLDAHSELMSTYPWGDTTPSQTTVNQPDSGQVRGGALVFRERADSTSPIGAHDWAAAVGSRLSPTGSALGPDFRGPQDPPVICPASSSPDPQPARCDDTAYGRGTGGQLTYQVPVRAGHPTTVWFAVGGSNHGPALAQHAVTRVLSNPRGLLAAKVRGRRAVDARSRVSIPGDRLLQRSVRWSKQNLADSVQTVRGIRLRAVSAGTAFPPPAGTLPGMSWIGAGWPDYPWLFGTDGEFISFASVAMGQFTAIENHLRALRNVSEIVNHGSGKVVHEVTTDGAVYFGANSDPGNTDETAKFPSAVALVWRWTGDDRFRDQMYDFAVRGMHYIVDHLDADGDGWPEGLGNVERPGQGQETLDNTVYTIRGLRDLADMARSKSDASTARWASSTAAGMERRFEAAWWYGRGSRQYADSLADPGNVKRFQRFWIGVTPMDAMLVRPGRPTRPLADQQHGITALAQRERACYTGMFGLYHTGTGPTSDPAGNPGPTCDPVVSTSPSERDVFSLNTAIMAVAEGNFGRLGRDQQQFYTTGNARIQLDPRVWEMPGAMPEIAPEGDFIPNIDQPFTKRSMVLQAWGAYGNLWPVIHQQLGVSPDLGRNHVDVVAQVPDGQHSLAGTDIRLGRGWVEVRAAASSARLLTQVSLHRAGTTLTIGHVLPPGSRVGAVTLDGRRVGWRVEHTARGRELVTDTGTGRHTLAITLR